MRKLSIAIILVLAIASVCAQSPTRIPPPSPLHTSSQSTGQYLPDRYGELTGLTVLMAADLPKVDSGLIPNLGNDTNAAIRSIEAEWAKNGIEVVRDGYKFVKLLRAGWTNSPEGRQLARIPTPRSGGEETPRGYINWTSADLELVLSLYASVTGRTILRSPQIACSPIRLRNYSTLTRDDLVYAIKVLLAMNSIALIAEGDKFTQVVPLAQALEIYPRAPRSEAGVTLIDPKNIPVLRLTAANVSVKPPPPPAKRAQTMQNKLSELWMRARIALFGPAPLPPKPEVDSLVAYYARLRGARPIPSKQFGRQPVLFEIKTPVTKAELLYAIEATLAQSGLVIVSTNNNSIQLPHRSELIRANTNSPASLRR